MNRVKLILATAVCAPALAGVLMAADPPATSDPKILRVVIIPFQNATGDAAWDDWCYALPVRVRSCLDVAEFTEVSGTEATRKAMKRTGWEAGKVVDTKLGRQVAGELEADVAVWGSFRHQTNEWAAHVSVLRVDTPTAPVEIELTATNWLSLAESLALRVASHLGRKIPDDDRERWKFARSSSESALRLMVKDVAMECQEFPVSEREKVLRQALAEDPHFAAPRRELISLLIETNREEELEVQIQELLRQQPSFCDAHLAAAWVRAKKKDLEGADRELHEALRWHRGCPGAARSFFLLHAREEEWKALVKTLEEIHRKRPDETDTAIFLACARAQSGDADGAWTLLGGMNRLPEEDEVLDLALLGAATFSGRFDITGQEFTRLGPKAATSELVRDTLATVQFAPLPAADGSSNGPIVRPKEFTPAALSAELEQRLPADERTFVSNPLEITPKIIAEAHRLTVGLSNKSVQAVALFGEVARRGRGAGDGGQRTAGESLAASEQAGTRLSCQEHAKLFVALARALGLEAWMVHIEHDAYGLPCYHDCAALFLDGNGLLVDPTWRSFGIQHKAFTVLDDLQVISHQSMQLGGNAPDPRRMRAGLKLNPGDRWTQLQFVRGMAKAGEHAAAEEQLRKTRSAGAETWDTHEAAAELEMARERWKPALAELLSADALSPSNALVNVRLASVYLQLSDPLKSKEHTEAALRFDRGEIPAEIRRESPAQLAMLNAFAQSKSGDRASLDELKRRAEGGDPAAQFALAKLCFDDRPPRAQEGMRWLLQAAERGDDNAQFNYGRNLLALRGKDASDEASQWLTRSADQGNAEAQYWLGLLLYEGKLVARDNIAAGQWILLAIGNGSVEAKRLFKEMELFLSADEVAEARKRASAFKAKATKTGTGADERPPSLRP